MRQATTVNPDKNIGDPTRMYMFTVSKNGQWSESLRSRYLSTHFQLVIMLLSRISDYIVNGKD